MLKRTRLRISIVFTLLTGTILAVVLILLFISYKSQTEENAYLKYYLAVNDVVNYLMPGDTIDGNWLTSFEKEHEMVLFVKKNGEEVVFTPGTETKAPREEITSSLLSLFVEVYGFYDDKEVEYFVIMDENGQEIHVSVEGAWASEAENISPIEVADRTLNRYAEETNEYVTEGEAKEGEEPQDLAFIMKQDSFILYDRNNKEEKNGIGNTHISTSIERILLENTGMIRIETTSGDRLTGMALPGQGYNNNSFEIIALQDVKVLEQELTFLYVKFIAFFLLGIGMLALVSWYLAKIMLKPAADSIKQQADFVAAASHELRTPLAVIQSSLAAAKISDEEEAQRYQQMAEKEAQRMTLLVKDLLQLAGGDAGSWHLQKKDMDLDTVLINSSEQFTQLAKEKKIQLKLVLPEETLPMVKADEDRTKQVLAILLSNALQYSLPDTEVTILAIALKRKVEVKIIDHGKGIAEEDKKRIFERFYRTDGSRSKKENFGLGLSIAKELVELQGGKISEEDTPGGGATFCFTLPTK